MTFWHFICLATAALWNFVSGHAESLTIAVGIFWTAFSSTVPEERPKSLDDYWAWFRDFVHQAGNVRRPLAPKQ